MRGEVASEIHQPHLKRLNNSNRKFRKFQLNDIRERVHKTGNHSNNAVVDLTENQSNLHLFSLDSVNELATVKKTPQKKFKHMKFSNQKSQGVMLTKTIICKNQKLDNSVICLDSESDDSDNTDISGEALVNSPDKLHNPEYLKDFAIKSFKDITKNAETPSTSGTIIESECSVDLFYVDKNCKYKRADVPNYDPVQLIAPSIVKDQEINKLPVSQPADLSSLELESFTSVDFSDQENSVAILDESVVFISEVPGNCKNVINTHPGFFPVPSNICDLQEQCHIDPQKNSHKTTTNTQNSPINSKKRSR